MDKFFKELTKPAKLIFVIGSFVYTAIFAILTAGGIGGRFMSVMTNLIILVVGTCLLVAAPILILLNKNEAAKVVFLIIFGFWILSSIQSYYGWANARVIDGNDGLVITQGVFDFIIGLALTAVLVLSALEFMFKKKALRFISFLIMLGIIAFGVVTFIIALVNYIRNNAGWTAYLNGVNTYLLPAPVLFFGYLYFFGAPASK